MAAQSCGAHNGRAAPMCWFVHSGARSCGVHRLLQTFGVRTTMIGTRCSIPLTLILFASSVAAEPASPSDTDASLKVYAVNVNRTPKQSWPGYGIYLGKGLV